MADKLETKNCKWGDRVIRYCTNKGYLGGERFSPSTQQKYHCLEALSLVEWIVNDVIADKSSPLCSRGDIWPLSLDQWWGPTVAPLVPWHIYNLVSNWCKQNHPNYQPCKNCCVKCIFIGRYQEMQRTRFTDDLWHVHVKKIPLWP